MTKNHNTLSASSSNAPCGNRFIISAPSGAGKTTLCGAIRHRFPDMRYSVSYTTRAPRAGEQNGIDYHFISQDEFKDRLARNLWAEWAEVHGNYYGTSAEFLEKTVADGKDILLDIDVQGARQILSRFPDSVAIFIMPPSMAALKDRLTGRGTDAEADIERRLKNAVQEMAQQNLYHHVIINDQLETAISEFTRLIDDYRAGRRTCRSEASARTGRQA